MRHDCYELKISSALNQTTEAIAAMMISPRPIAAQKSFGQVVPGVAGGTAEEQPRGKDKYGHEEQRAPGRIVLRPGHKLIQEGQLPLKGLYL